MRSAIFVFLLIFIRLSSNAQLNIILSSYNSFDGRTIPVYLIEARYTVINIDTSIITGEQLSDSSTLQRLVTRTDTLYAFYKNNLGYEPAGGNPNYSYKANVFFGSPSCGSGCVL
jgi:hypothetical protein